VDASTAPAEIGPAQGNAQRIGSPVFGIPKFDHLTSLRLLCAAWLPPIGRIGTDGRQPELQGKPGATRVGMGWWHSAMPQATPGRTSAAST